MNDKRINVPVPETLKKAARLEAESQGESLATYTRLALKEKLDRDRENTAALLAYDERVAAGRRKVEDGARLGIA